MELLDQIYPKNIFPVESRNINCFKHFSQRFLYFEHFKRKIGYFLSPGLFILKLYKAFQTTVQIAIISKVMIKFRLKFQFQTPLQFYRTVEKIETCDGSGQTFWQVPLSFNILVTIFLFMIEIQAY